MWEKKTKTKNNNKKKNKKKKKKQTTTTTPPPPTYNFKIPRAHVYPQTTSKMSVKFQKHLLKAVGEVVLTRYLLLYTLS